MKNRIYVLILSLAFCLVGQKAFAEPDTSRRPPFFVNLRGGFLIDSADASVKDKWEHDIFNSYVFSVGAFRTFPYSWREFYFFAGPEVSYMDSEEYISGINKSSLSSTFLQVFLTGGLTWRPAALGVDWTFSLFTGFEVWGEQETTLYFRGFNRSLGTKSPATRNPAFLSNTVVGLNACYDISWEWSTCLNYENRGANVITAGVNYGF